MPKRLLPIDLRSSPTALVTTTDEYQRLASFHFYGRRFGGTAMGINPLSQVIDIGCYSSLVSLGRTNNFSAFIGAAVTTQKTAAKLHAHW